MPYNDELDREYTKREARFWRELKHAVRAGNGIASVYPVAREVGLNKQQEKDIIRRWKNEDLLRAVGGGTAKVTLTPFGRQFRFEDRYKDIEES